MVMGNNSEKIRVLAVDDDLTFLDALQTLFGREGLQEWVQLVKASNAAAATNILHTDQIDAVLLDKRMPDLSGEHLLKLFRAKYSELPILMLTADGQVSEVVKAMQAGATDYVLKDPNTLQDELPLKLQRALQQKSLMTKNKKLEAKLVQECRSYEMIGNSLPILKMRSDIQRLRGQPTSVLILGDSGTGKELVARALSLQEENGTERPFIPINCGAIPDNLAESEFFGHERGAFTGASQKRDGKFLAANGGDLFLDEIAELPLQLQAKLLRAIQEKTITPVGSNKNIKVDVRIIAATHRNLDQEVRLGRFRQDLFYRLSVVQLRVPSLRERKEDIPLLVSHFLDEVGGSHLKLTKEALAELEKHEWPGNIRALRNCIERAKIMAVADGKTVIGKEYIAIDTALAEIETPSIPSHLLPTAVEEVNKDRYKECIEWAEKIFLERAWTLSRFNQSKLAELTGFHRETVKIKLKNLGLISDSSNGTAQCS